MRVCPRCQGNYQDESRFCPRDGVPLPAAAGPPPQDKEAAHRNDRDPRIGTVLFGQFELLEVCGRGAMGTVYRAWQQGMERQVAVKILRGDLVRDTAVVKRFQREARAVARLAHPNIVTIFLIGETDDRLPFLVLEYVEGEPLSELLFRERALPPARALGIVRQTASALADAHAEGIIHRDLKPANILITQRRRAPDFVKVLDFGIAKIIQTEGAPAESQNLTRTGAIFGTPHYIAPEQAAGNEVDHRADLYSLGVILYRMLVGRLPFEGAGVAVLLAHMNAHPPRPRELNPALDPAVEELIMTALAKDPSGRFASAEALADAIDQVAERLPVPSLPAVPTGVSSRTLKGVVASPAATAAFSASQGSLGGFAAAPDAGGSSAALVPAGGQAPAEQEDDDSDDDADEAPRWQPAPPPSVRWRRPPTLDEWRPQSSGRGRSAAVAAIGAVIVAGLAAGGAFLLGRATRTSAPVAEAAQASDAGAPPHGDSLPPPKTAETAPETVEAGQTGRPAPPETAEPTPVKVPPARQSIALGEGGYAVRALLPPRVVTDVETELEVEVLDPDGKPLAAKSLPLTIEEPGGITRSVSMGPAGAPGTFVLRRKFLTAGRYHVHVFPDPKDAEIHVWFDMHVEPVDAVARAAARRNKGKGSTGKPTEDPDHHHEVGNTPVDGPAPQHEPTPEHEPTPDPGHTDPPPSDSPPSDSPPSDHPFADPPPPEGEQDDPYRLIEEEPKPPGPQGSEGEPGDEQVAPTSGLQE